MVVIIVALRLMPATDVRHRKSFIQTDSIFFALVRRYLAIVVVCPASTIHIMLTFFVFRFRCQNAMYSTNRFGSKQTVCLLCTFCSFIQLLRSTILMFFVWFIIKRFPGLFAALTGAAVPLLTASCVCCLFSTESFDHYD